MSTFLNRLNAAERLHRSICHDWCFPDAKISNDPSFGPFVSFGRYRAYTSDEFGNVYRLFINLGDESPRLSQWVPLSKPETLSGMSCFIYSLHSVGAIEVTDDAIEVADSDLEYFEKWKATQ